jgi:hypothetical protein
MPRYLIERTLDVAQTHVIKGEDNLRAIAAANVRDQVTWIHSYISTDRRRMFCLYDASSPEAIRHASGAVGLPIDQITEVSVIDPYFSAP